MYMYIRVITIHKSRRCEFEKEKAWYTEGLGGREGKGEMELYYNLKIKTSFKKE